MRRFTPLPCDVGVARADGEVIDPLRIGLFELSADGLVAGVPRRVRPPDDFFMGDVIAASPRGALALVAGPALLVLKMRELASPAFEALVPSKTTLYSIRWGRDEASVFATAEGRGGRFGGFWVCC